MASDNEPKKKRMGKILPAAILAVGLMGGGAMATGKVGAKSEPAAAEEHKEVEPGVSITLDPQTISLRDGHYLKVAISLQLPHEIPEDAPYAGLAAEGHMKPEAFKEAYAAQALDETVTVMSRYTYDELSTPEGKAKAKTELADSVRKRYHDSVMDVYFTELVLQRA